MPDLGQILKLENQSRHGGSGLQAEKLLGAWRLDRVADRQAQEMDPFRSALLRMLGARLDIGPTDGPEELILANSVHVGALMIRFVGRGRLQGKRPLLRFHFDRVQLRLGPWRVLEGSLSPPAERKAPFFALIASGQEETLSTGQVERWLAARGRSGGIAVWYRLEVPPPPATAGN